VIFGETKEKNAVLPTPREKTRASNSATPKTVTVYDMFYQIPSYTLTKMNCRFRHLFLFRELSFAYQHHRTYKSPTFIFNSTHQYYIIFLQKVNSLIANFTLDAQFYFKNNKILKQKATKSVK